MSCPAVEASGPSWPQPVIRAKISRGLTRSQSCGPMPRRSQVPGRKQSSSTSALATRSSSAGRFGLHVEVDDPLAAVEQVDVLGGHLQTTAGPAHPHHVGAEVCQDHRSMRPGPDTAQFDDPDAGQGSGILHGRRLIQPPFLTLSTCLRNPSVAVSIAALDGALEHETWQRHRQVDAEVEPQLGLVAVGCERVLGILRVQLAGLDQRPAHHVVGPGVLDHLVISQTRGLDLHLDLVRPAVVIGVQDLGALVLGRPARCGLDVGDDVEDLLGCRFDDHFARIFDCHGVTIARSEIRGAVRR